MFRKTAVIADADKASAKSIKHTLRRSGYKVILADTARKIMIKSSIDLLILFAPVNVLGIAPDISEKGLIIGINRLTAAARKLREAAVLSSYGTEQLLRERYLGTSVGVRFLRTGSGWDGDTVEGGLHDFAEADIPQLIARTAALHFADRNA